MELDWNAYHFRGRPVALLSSGAPGFLHEAAAMMDAIRSSIEHPISSILRPPHTTKTWVPRRGLIDVPGPTPREAAYGYAGLLSDSLLYADEQLRHARTHAKYVIRSVSYWGDPPEDLAYKLLPLPPDFDNRFLLAYQRVRRLNAAVRRKQQLLRFALEIIETYAPGQVFRYRDARLRTLAREPQPLVVKAHRDAMGVLWTIQGDEDAELRDVHKLGGMASESTSSERAGG